MSSEVMTIEDFLWNDEPIKGNWVAYVRYDGAPSYIENVRSCPYDDDHVKVRFFNDEIMQADGDVWMILPVDQLVYGNEYDRIFGEDWCENYTPTSENGLKVARLVATSVANGRILQEFNLYYDVITDNYKEIEY